MSIPGAYPLIAAYLGCSLTKSRLIIDVRDPHEELVNYKYRRGFSSLIARILRKINYSIYRRADAVTAVTRTLVHILTKEISRPIYLVPNGADLKVFVPIDKRNARERFRLNQDSFLVVYIGALTHGLYYNVLPVLKAVRKIRERTDINIKVVVAGPIYYYEKIIESFKDVLHYMGILDVYGIVALLSACDVAIIPRLGDPIYDYAIPVKFYEYVAMGLPLIVIVNKESELAKIVEDNKLGFICEPSDHNCLVKAIIAFATNKALLGEYKKNVLAFRRHIDRRIGAERLYKLISNS